MVQDSVLLVCLAPEESDHIRQLLSSFEIEVASEDICPIEEVKLLSDKTNICLAVLRVDKDRKRPDQEIQQLRRQLPNSVPILLLIPPEQTRKTKDYLCAGADDYWVLPLDETAFSVRFYVLLEYGQAIVHSGPIEGREKRPKIETSLLKRIVNRFQDSLHFFSPKQLVQPETSPSIARKWEKVRRLGFGGDGEVWLIREREKKNLAVAKIPHTPKMNIKALRAAAILKRLALHHNVVHLLEVVKEEGKVILIQEYVQGNTLLELLDSGMDATLKEKAFLQLLAVSSHAHQHKIMHRDIKPENIIITPSGDLKLLDFGIAKDLSRQSISYTVAGSRPYMAPEQIMGKSSIASDVWALGVILYLFSTKYLPFYHDNEKQLMDLILETHPLPPCQLVPELPKNLESVIFKCLKKDPAERYANAVELRADLLKLVSGFGKENVLPNG